MATNTTFDRETLLDLTVNIIPLVIILVFFVLFLVIQPWGPLLSFMSVISFGLLIVPFGALAALTYISGKAIADDEAAETTSVPGRSNVPPGATPSESDEQDSEVNDHETADESEPVPESDAESHDSEDDDDEKDADSERSEATE